MTPRILVLWLLVLILPSCNQRRRHVTESYDNPHILHPGPLIPSTGKAIDPDSVAKPAYLTGKGKYSPAPRPEWIKVAPDYFPSGQSRHIQAALVSIDTAKLAPPRYIPAKGRVQFSPRPVWKPAQLLATATARHACYKLNVGYFLNDNWVGNLLEDRRGRIWMGMGVGVTVWDGTGFLEFGKDQHISHVWSLLEDREGKIWIGKQKNGVSCWDGSAFTHFTKEDGLLDNEAKRLATDNSGRIWIGTAGGVSIWDGKGFLNFTKENGLPDNFVLGLFHDSQDRMWVSTEGGLCVWDGVGFRQFTQSELTRSLVWSFAEDQNGAVWIGFFEKGLGRWDGNGFTLYTRENGLSGNSIQGSLFFDRAGNLWVPAFGFGLNRWDGSGFKQYTGENGFGSTIWAMLEDRDGRKWMANGEEVVIWNSELEFGTENAIGTEKKDKVWVNHGPYGIGVNIPGKDGFLHYPITEQTWGNRVLSMFEDSWGRTWIGNEEGAYLWDGQGFTAFYLVFEDADFNESQVRAFAEDRTGRVWIGTVEGVYVWDGAGFTVYGRQQGVLGSKVYSLLAAQNGDIWIGTDEGLNRWDGHTFTHFTTRDRLAGTKVQGFAEDLSGRIWIGTDTGLSVWDGHGFLNFNETGGLNTDNIQFLRPDENGFIWLKTAQGIDYIRWKDQDGPFILQHYDMADGVDEIFASLVKIDNLNRRWEVALANPLDLVNHHLLRPDTTAPVITLNELEPDFEYTDWRQLQAVKKIKGNSPSGRPENPLTRIRFDSILAGVNLPFNPRFPYDINQLTFKWNAIQTSAPLQLKYSYMLEGADHAWSPLTAEKQTTYRDLRQGSYTFKVRAAGGNGHWSPTAAYAFSIRPPWWAAWWAYILYVLLALGILYLLRAYELRRKLTQSEAKRLLELDTYKTRLYANITHEFRTPLTVILGMVGQIKTQPEKWFDQGLKMIRRNGQQLLDLVNQLLDLSKLDKNKLKQHMECGDVIGFIHYLIQSFESYAAGKDIRLHFQRETDALEMDFDPDNLTKIINNLISNALKYTPEGGQIILTATHGEWPMARPVPTKDSVVFTAEFPPGCSEVLQLTVRDTGSGMDEKELPHIFDRFYQVDSSSTRKTEGSGIGLALVRELVFLMAGAIRVESRSGEGTAFSIILPISRTAPKARFQFSDFKIRDYPPTAPELISISDMADDRPNILLIEDNRDVLAYLASCLEGDYHLDFAMNGRQGIEKALEIVPDIIISDIMMPEKDGYEVCAALKEDLRTSHVPIVLLTARASQQSRIEGLVHGADAYLTKPFEKEELYLQIRNLTVLRQNMQARFSGIKIKADSSKPLTREEVFLRDLQDLIEANLGDEDFGIPDLCKNMGMSRSQLHKKLTALTGKSASIYLRAYRLDRAKELLLQTDLNISEVAYQVGFRTPVYFTQVFTEAFGMPPTVFRSGGTDLFSTD